VYNNGLALVFEALNMLHMMFHEATACHVTPEMTDLVGIFCDLLRAVKAQQRGTSASEIAQVLSRWKDMPEMTSRLLTLCNSYTPPELREMCFSAVKEMLILWPQEMLAILVPLMHRAHALAGEAASADTSLGPYFPRKGLQTPSISSAIKAVRPPRPMLQMSVPRALDARHGQDAEYDRALHRYFLTYHGFVDFMVRLAVNENNLTKLLVDLSAMVGLDGVILHMQLFPKLWIDIYNTEVVVIRTIHKLFTSSNDFYSQQQIDRKYVTMLVQSQGFLEYTEAVLLDERLSLNNSHIFNFLFTLFPKVSS
jgi:ubiquitin carboxyl-terminal hydrolase 34